MAQGLAKASMLLAGQYYWVVTNVPYLTRGKQGEGLRTFCEKYYKEAKNDLATVFLIRCLEMCVTSGTTSIVLPQNWLFLTSYRKFREKLLKNDTWHLIARLGPGAFETPMWDFNVQLLTLSRGNKIAETSSLFDKWQDANSTISSLDVSESRTSYEKSKQLRWTEVFQSSQEGQLMNVDSRVTLSPNSNHILLSKYADSGKGICTFDSPRFLMVFWERQKIDNGFIPSQSTVEKTKLFDGAHHILLWENGKGSISDLMESKRKTGYNTGAWQVWSRFRGRQGVVVSPMGTLSCTKFLGHAFDNNTAVIVPKNEDDMPALWCFCSSPDYHMQIRQIDNALKVTEATLVKINFDIEHWRKAARNRCPNGFPRPYSDDPTQWIFHGNPCGSAVWNEEKKWTAIGPLRTDATVLQVAVARLLGYRWPAELDADMELADEQREWVSRCEKLLSYADKDGLVSIPPVRGEASAADRLLNLLAAAYGDAWSNDTIAELLKNANHAGKTLETWLREKFFTQHCKLFKHRPFIWHIWDGLRDGFAALVNYHKLDRKNLETLIYTYLGDWIKRQKQDIITGVDGAEEKLAAAEGLKKRLELILEGESPYDIFVRWKPIEKQPIGWAPDLNDGVRLNIKPFMTVPDVGKKGAGILRDKPNIKWNKDRGKDVTSAPWYHLFKGDRINDHHLALAEKSTAQEAIR